MKEIYIKEKCIKQLKKIPIIKDIEYNSEKVLSYSKIIQDELKITTEKGNIIYNVETKSILKRPIPQHLSLEMENIYPPLLIMAEYINPSIGKDLENININYIDTAGNMYLYVPDIIYIHKTGKTVEKKPEKNKSKLTQSKGLQLLSCILANDKYINLTIRELASVADISIGWTSKLKNELKAKGYLHQKGKNTYKLVRKDELFKKWLINYQDKLRPSLLLETYRLSSENFDNIDKILTNNIENPEYSFGGEYAADKLIKYYRPKIIDLFINPDHEKQYINKLNLVPATKEYNIRLFNQFSDKIQFETNDTNYNIIHPIFIYAELLSANNDRSRQTAELIYDKYIKDIVKQ